jgi:hypothetical protein
MPTYPPCPQCGSTTACRCGWADADHFPITSPDQPGPTVTIATVYPGATKANWERSVAIWQEQDRIETDERRRLIADLEYEERKSRF